MQVILKSAQMLGNKSYKAGKQEVPDNLYANVKFKQLVKSGEVIVVPRDHSAQAIQASKDARNASKAAMARKLTAGFKAPAPQPKAEVKPVPQAKKKGK